MERLSVPATLESLEKLRRYAGEAAAGAGIDESRAYGLQLAVDEIATNIITYGYKGEDPAATLSIRADIRDGSLIVITEDRAPAFDPRTSPAPDAGQLAKPLEDRPMGGLGIYLAIHNVDRFNYRREGERNLNIFELRIAPAVPAG